jgi:DNA repair ATPase RecN
MPFWRLHCKFNSLVFFEVDAGVGGRDFLAVNNFGLFHPTG